MNRKLQKVDKARGDGRCGKTTGSSRPPVWVSLSQSCPIEFYKLLVKEGEDCGFMKKGICTQYSAKYQIDFKQKIRQTHYKGATWGDKPRPSLTSQATLSLVILAASAAAPCGVSSSSVYRELNGCLTFYALEGRVGIMQAWLRGQAVLDLGFACASPGDPRTRCDQYGAAAQHGRPGAAAALHTLWAAAPPPPRGLSPSYIFCTLHAAARWLLL